MEKYIKAEMEIVVFEAEDVIMTSGCTSDCACVDPTGGFAGEAVCFIGTSR
ncbi:MAG: hypothetical protein IJY27_03550 [Clostridia bacterium]|nr:hypothetical protein [Clostridia bacterium]